MKKFLLVILTMVFTICCFGLIACQHEHSYDQKVTKSAYRKSIATCTKGAVYYKSCSCGKVGAETFETEALGHLFVNRDCLRCDQVLLTSEGLIYRTNDDGTCYVDKVGFCTDFDIVIPSTYGNKTVIGINDEAFKECDFLQSITIPSCISSIGENAFYGCKNLKTVIFEENSQLNSIGKSVFENCTTLTDISIPSTLNTITRSSFANCISLEEIILPNSIVSIENEAFSRCDKLKNLLLPNSLENIGELSFEHCASLETITIPSSVSAMGAGAFSNCLNLIEIKADNNQNYKTIDGNLYSGDGETLLQYAIGKTANYFAIPNGVTTVAYKAFCYANNLVSITIPNSLVLINEEAFDYCDKLIEIYNLSNINIQKGSNKNGNIANKARDIYTSLDAQSKIKIVDDYVIYEEGQEISLMWYIGSQSTVAVPNNVTKIESSAFENSYNLQSVLIPDSVITICDFAFAYCYSLTSVTIGKGVQNIEFGAFLGSNKLESIIYTGTKGEWNNITKGTSWDFSTGKYTITCSDGIIE